MKSRNLFVLIGIAAMATGCAHDKDAVNSSGNYPGKTNAPYITGSNLPQEVNRSGPVTDGRNNVRVLDQSDIDRSGGADLKQALRNQGVTP